MANENNADNSASADAAIENGGLTAAHSVERASMVILTVGVIQLLGVLMPLLVPGGEQAGSGAGKDGSSSTASSFVLNGWTITLGITGVVYLFCGIPIRFRYKPAVWVGMTAALAQAIVFVILALFGIVAGIRTRDPGTLTMGVLIFGTIASIHLFVLRWLWTAR